MVDSSSGERAHLPLTNGTQPKVVWGWKRSSWENDVSRLVYFVADCESSASTSELRNSRLVLIRRGGELGAILENAKRIRGALIDSEETGFRLSLGQVGQDDLMRIGRLDASGRYNVRNLSHTPETPDLQQTLKLMARKHPRLIVYAGSGLSYEAGVPMLSTMHELFGVDGGPGTEFSLGNPDPLVDGLAANSFGWFVKQVHGFHSILAATEPSLSHRRLGKAYENGGVSLVLTDNVDRIFEDRLGIPVLRTRGDGLVSLKYPGLDAVMALAESVPHVFLVVGVSADRRGIIGSISQVAPTIIVNPAQPVSPHCRNLDYLGDLGFDDRGRSEKGHVFIKREAKAVVAKVLAILGRA